MKMNLTIIATESITCSEYVRRAEAFAASEARRYRPTDAAIAQTWIDVRLPEAPGPVHRMLVKRIREARKARLATTDRHWQRLIADSAFTEFDAD